MKISSVFIAGILLSGVFSGAGELPQQLPSGSFKVTAVSGKKNAPEKTELCFDGRLNTFPKFDRLNGSELTLELDKPLPMAALSLTQTGWGNWAHPASLEINVNRSHTLTVNLEKQAANPGSKIPGKIQTIPINTDVTYLKIKVTAVHSVNKIQWGNIGEIGYFPPESSAAAADIADSREISAGQALYGEHLRPLTVTEWNQPDFSASGINGAQKAPQTLSAAFTARKEAVFRPLAGSRISITFPKSRTIGLVALRQTKNAGAARIRELAVSVNDGPKQLFEFLKEHDVQAIPINGSVNKLSFDIRSAYPGKNGTEWGGIALIGDGEFAPVTFSTAAMPFPMATEALELEIEAERAMTVPLTANIVHPRLLYRAPELALKPGKHKYTLPVSAFRETGKYGVDWKPCHFRSISIGNASTEADPGFRLYGIRPVVPAGSADFPWYELGAFAPPTRKIDGKLWWEGMSYSSGGRFGNSTYNGLLSEVVGDLWFHTYTAGARDPLRRQKFDLYVDGDNTVPGELDSAQPWNIRGMGSGANEEIESSWTHMRRKLKLRNGAELTWLTSTLAPGFLGECSVPLTISSRGGGDIPKRSGAPDEDENRFFSDANRDAQTGKIGPTLVITPSGVISGPGQVEMSELTEPWIVAVWGGINRPAFWGDRATAVLFTLDRGTVRFDRSGIHLPGGRFGISSCFHGLLNDNWEAEKIQERASLISGMLRNYPYRCTEFYRIEGETLFIHNMFEYERWGGKRFRAPDYAPLPPILSWGYSRFGWGNLPFDPARTIRTPAGPYTWNPGSRTGYTLPIPLNRHAAFPALAEYRSFNDALAEKFLKQPEPLPAEWHYVADSWRTAYMPLRVGNALFGMSFLGDAYRRRVLDTLKTTTVNAFSDFSWVPRRELFGSHRYLASLWIDNKVSPAMYGDINSGVGASCYSLYLYAKYSGDWEHVRALWPRVMDVIRFCEVVNDWAIPMTSAREGILFGGIDMDTIGFLGVAAAEQMARQTGSREDWERLAYLRSKIAPATALRLTFQQYLDPAGEYPRLWVNGFSESGPNLEWADSKSGVSLDHVAMTLCWQGQQPEMFQFLMQLPGRKTMTDFQKILMDQYFTGKDFSGWRKMPFNPTRTAAHLAMRCWLPDWDRAEIDRDYRIWIDRTKSQESVNNSGFFAVWQGSVDRVFLINWEPAALEKLTYDRSTYCLLAVFSSAVPFTVEGSALQKIVRIEVDGRELPLAQLQYENDVFKLKLPPLKGEVKFYFMSTEQKNTMLCP